MSHLNDNSLSSLERSHPNKGLTLENLSVKSLNKKLNKSLNKSLNSSNNSFRKQSKKDNNRLSDRLDNNNNNNYVNTAKSKQSTNHNNYNHNNKNSNLNNNRTNKQNQINNFQNNNLNNNSNINDTQLSSNNKFPNEDEYTNYNINEICVDNEKYLNALNEALMNLDNNNNGGFGDLNLNEKMDKLLELSTDERKNVRLGALVCLYLLLVKYFNELKDTDKTMILKQILILLQTYEKQDELFLLSCLEICSLFGDNDLLIDNLGMICMFLTDFNFPKLQKASFNCLMSTEFNGIRILVELASKDEQDYQKYILNQLIHTPHIQRIIIINAIFNDLYSNDYKKRNIALSAINRLNVLINDDENLEKIDDLFSEKKINSQFISSILRNRQGEKYLLNELKTNKDPEIRAAICNVLCYRFPKKSTPLKIRIDTNMNISIPGSFYNYYGKTVPVLVPCTKNIDEILENEEIQIDDSTNNIIKLLGVVNDTSEDYLEVSNRDFLAALQRMILIQYDHQKPQIIFEENNKFNSLDHLKYLPNERNNNNQNEENDDNEEINYIKENNGSKEYPFVNKYATFLELDTNEKTNQDEYSDNFESEYEYISEDVIKALGKCLSDYSPKVREAAATSLGIIGLPEALVAIDDMVQNINDDDVNVKAKIIWSIGRIAQGVDDSVIPNIYITVQNNMWKIKKASFYALSQFGDRCNKSIIPYLINLLKESAINKQLIAETIVKLGIEGENALLLLMSNESDNNYKLKSAVIRGYAFTDINSPTIDFILESIFKQCNNEFSLVRKSCIFTIHELAERAQENITYLKKKNIIPFYYEKLKDKDINIQGYAINCIKNLGTEGELIFIEGFTKDKNYLTRINCGLGLADNGIQNMRTLLLGLQDKNKNVRNAIEKVIIVKMPISEVVEYFSNLNQLESLKITVKDLLDKKKFLQLVTVGYLEKLMGAIEECQINNNEGSASKNAKTSGEQMKYVNENNYAVENNQDGQEYQEEEQQEYDNMQEQRE